MPIPSATARFPRVPSIAACAAVFLGLTFSGLALALEWNLQPAASRLAAEIQDLHEYVMVLCAAIFVGVFGFMFWSVYAHRKSKGHQAEEFHEHTTVEMLWTAIPALILTLIAWPATRLAVAQTDTAAADLTTKVTGIQWKWAYDSLTGAGEGISRISTLSTPREQTDGPSKKWSLEELKARGEKVYAATCVACHQASGKGLPPAFPPLDGSRIATGSKPGHIDIVLNGKPNTAMAAFGKQLSDTEIAAVIAYERNSWGNKAGEVQPAEVKARRK